MITTPIAPDLVHGALELEHTAQGTVPHRLPGWARARGADAQLALTEAQPSGVRLRFRTAATAVELDTVRTRMTYRGMPPRPDGVCDLLVDGQLAGQANTSGGHLSVLDMTTGTSETQTGPIGTISFTGLPGRVKDVEVWLPHNEATELVALRTDAAVEPVSDTGRRVWLHHGSSISQGSNAAGPSRIWPALAASLGGVDLVNLGFGGSAMLDPFTARVMRDTPADLLSVKIGINIVNADLMRLRAFVPAVHGPFDTLRDGHPTTPLLIISPLLCPIHEDAPGPGAVDLDELKAGRPRFTASGDPDERRAGKLTLNVIRETLAGIVAQRAAEDPHLHYLDGRDLYGKPDATELPLPDNLHPDDATHRLVGERFAHHVFGEHGPFAG